MPQVNKAVLSLIKHERDGNIVDAELLKSILEVYKYLTKEKIAGAS